MGSVLLFGDKAKLMEAYTTSYQLAISKSFYRHCNLNQRWVDDVALNNLIGGCAVVNRTTATRVPPAVPHADSWRTRYLLKSLRSVIVPLGWMMWSQWQQQDPKTSIAVAATALVLR